MSVPALPAARRAEPASHGQAQLEAGIAPREQTQPPKVTAQPTPAVKPAAPRGQWPTSFVITGSAHRGADLEVKDPSGVSFGTIRRTSGPSPQLVVEYANALGDVLATLRVPPALTTTATHTDALGGELGSVVIPPVGLRGRASASYFPSNLSAELVGEGLMLRHFTLEARGVVVASFDVVDDFGGDWAVEIYDPRVDPYFAAMLVALIRNRRR